MDDPAAGRARVLAAFAVLHGAFAGARPADIAPAASEAVEVLRQFLLHVTQQRYRCLDARGVDELIATWANQIVARMNSGSLDDLGEDNLAGLIQDLEPANRRAAARIFMAAVQAAIGVPGVFIVCDGEPRPEVGA